jgi:hypothetical protein
MVTPYQGNALVEPRCFALLDSEWIVGHPEVILATDDAIQNPKEKGSVSALAIMRCAPG